MKGKAIMATVALGAAYLLRNEKSRNKLMNQFKSMASGLK
ncbi:hypothetical protein J8TS2_27250 [Lederbergia ruris]|uniref:Uncharacterized protein n=1 Tax=Lederbergia ruris TaxID=217495 RepID=A0ABQ4KLR2_9BACI|nr:hypothetical protein J8TS2_27250 [Lederbergia ruris]